MIIKRICNYCKKKELTSQQHDYCNIKCRIRANELRLYFRTKIKLGKFNSVDRKYLINNFHLKKKRGKSIRWS